MLGHRRYIDELDLISQQNTSNITNWNSHEVDVVDALIDDIISAQAKAYPSKEAVVGWDGRFTYQELEEAAERFAQSLRELGVRPDTLVPICFEKSIWTIIAIVAILKAGGAFVPLDPSYPKERL